MSDVIQVSAPKQPTEEDADDAQSSPLRAGHAFNHEPRMDYRSFIPSPKFIPSDASSVSSFSGDLLGRGVTFRARVSPPLPVEVELAEVLCVALGVDCELHGLKVGSLAPSVDGSGQVATISFETTPEVLLASPKAKEWAFTDVNVGKDTAPISVILDTHFLGLTVLSTPKASGENVIDCVAISGIGSHAFGSFKERGGTHMWLRDSLPSDIPNLRIMVYGYHSALDKSPSSHEIEDFGREFKEHLIEMRSYNDTRRRLVFIAHSFGGIIIKEALLQMNRSSDDTPGIATVDSVKALLGFGVPNLGFDVTSLMPIVSGHVNQPFVESLTNGSSKLRRLNEEWMQLVQSHRIELFSFYEALKSPTAVKLNDRWRMAGPPSKLIDEASATSGHHPWQTEAIIRTHSELVKFRKDDDVYLRVRDILTQIISERVENTT